MSLRILTLLSLYCITNGMISAGGVTVGNGQGRIIVGLSLRNNAHSEKELTAYAEDVIKSIRNGQHQKINKMINDGHCDQKYTNIHDLNINEFIPIINGELVEYKEFIGYMQLELKDCETSEYVVSEEPYGGQEFWGEYNLWPRSF